jgi:hypothetical protein
MSEKLTEKLLEIYSNIAAHLYVADYWGEC